MKTEIGDSGPRKRTDNTNGRRLFFSSTVRAERQKPVKCLGARCAERTRCGAFSVSVRFLSVCYDHNRSVPHNTLVPPHFFGDFLKGHHFHTVVVSAVFKLK